ncbi:DUF3304 domain-containing protein [Pseudomonas putida]|uniref:DUF3304 domain-containing protein n=1 Tax=Pseudomonas putida TaxID=303 RepID=UPI0023632374|nr:DUF3304 domain-containing protein [Pseudomonas putida]MDD1964721.1 DUF3304 domain-containing protein [Pseudomonas putida]
MTSFKPMQSQLSYSLIFLLLMLGLVGCEKKPKVIEPSFINITAYNHTEDYIHQYYVDQSGGANVRAYGGGGKFTCCIGVPGEWRPGMMATVRWTTSASRKSKKPYTGETWHEERVLIEPYDEEATTLGVHFLPMGKVRLIISRMGAGHPDYPGPAYPVPPADWPVD